MTINFDEIEQTTTVVSMTLGLRSYDNGRKNNMKTVTFFFYTMNRQRSLGEYVPVYTSEIRKYDYFNAKLNFMRSDVMLKDFCRNEESTLLKFELYELKKEIELKNATEEEKMAAMEDYGVEDEDAYVETKFDKKKKIIVG